MVWIFNAARNEGAKDMRLYKQKYSDRNGHSRETENFYCEITDHAGIVRRIPAFSDERASEEFGRKVECLVSLRVAGMEPSADLTRWLSGLADTHRDRLAKIGLLDARRVAASKLLSEHLEDWKKGLAAKGNTAAHAATQHKRAKALTVDAGAATWQEITPTTVHDRIEHLRKEATGKRKKAMGAKSANHYLSAVKTFCRWMVKQRRASDNPCECLEPINDKAVRRDARHERRALTATELRTLITTTLEQPERFGMSGRARALLYRLAAETGLRAGECRSLTRQSFEFSPKGGRVTVRPEDTKNGRGADLPLKPDTAALLAKHVENMLPCAPAFNAPELCKFVKMFRADLKAAGIAYRDSKNFVADFHGLRHTFITNLANSGVHPKVAMDLARHSNINLTMSRYSHTVMEQRSEAVALLPNLNAEIVVVEKTGTDDRDVSYRKSYRNDADSETVAADSGGRSTYEKDYRRRDLNPRHMDYDSIALPTELRRQRTKRSGLDRAGGSRLQEKAHFSKRP